ncbi:TolC family protein [Arenibacter sp. GZD96]|uniref:TolC family protein n=1 Tax=Aurantibrevibacter litoralis TaxID=3106030 RepID=UPI002B001679|nr:TolC family protein [Arenibacter sp. GZD-96]MEA1787187.1 TolC family protein [Arenibacter sp. GZD-96]
MRKMFIFFLVWVFAGSLFAQDTLVLSFNEYLGYVKKHHPIAKQANLVVSMGQANLLKSRGGFDPKIEVDYDRKQFKGTEYWDRFNATFKIPTWYGLELKGNFEQNDGEFLNNAESLPEDGLYSAGVSLALGQGLWINDRMATLKKAKFFLEQTRADRELLVNQILFEASMAYFNWLLAYKERNVYRDFLENAQLRLKAIETSATAGDIAAIDTVEAKIAYQTRALNLEQANVALQNRALQLSNFLWIGDNIPMELQPNVVPDVQLKNEVDITLEILGKPLDSFTLENHPKLRSLGFKMEGLRVDKNLKANKLLPKIDVEYNFLTESPTNSSTFLTQEYKGGLNFVFPLFLRKERGDLKLAKFKLRDTEYELDNTRLEIRNKVLAIYTELQSFERQDQLSREIVTNYDMLLAAEERKFSFGESSLFLINTRESQLISAELKQIEIEYKYLSAKAKLFNSLALDPLNL